MDDNKFPKVTQAIISFTVISKETFFEGVLHERHIVTVELGHDYSVFVHEICQSKHGREDEIGYGTFKNLKEYAECGFEETRITEKVKEFMVAKRLPLAWTDPLKPKSARPFCFRDKYISPNLVPNSVCTLTCEHKDECIKRGDEDD